jgi:hypothetical protein
LRSCGRSANHISLIRHTRPGESRSRTEAFLPMDKSGRVYVEASVPLLHPQAQAVEEMLEGWRNQQQCRNLDHDTMIIGRERGWPISGSLDGV